MELRRGGTVAAVAVMMALAGCRGGGTATPGGEASGTGTPPPTDATAVVEPTNAMPGTEPAWALQQQISVEVGDVPLTQVAAQLARGKSLGIVYDDKLASGALAQPITLKLTGVSLDSALYWMATSAGLAYYFDEKRVVLTTSEMMPEERKAQLEKFRGAMERRWRGAIEKNLDSQKITCDMEDVLLGEAAGELQEHYGVNIMATRQMMLKKVSAKLEDRPMREVVDALAKSAGANWTLEHEAIHFEEEKH